MNNSFPYRDSKYNQNNKNAHQQTRFDERYNQQYNQYPYHSSPLGSIAAPDLSATLIYMTKIQSRSFGGKPKKSIGCLQ